MKSESSLVLIVDDMMINRMIISSLLASNGVMSDQVESGKECLKLCKEKDYDLILLDHRMPEFDGVDTLVALKELFREKGREIPVICHTTEEGRDNINLYKAAGFADVLIKPIEPKELSDVLMTYLPEGDEVTDDEPIDVDAVDDSVEIDTRDELDKLPDWLKLVPHLDLVKGVANCGSAEDYIDALYVFVSSIDDKSSTIANHRVHMDLTNYKLTVHSLKSLARLVGARDLSKMAANLETAAENGDVGIIVELTDDLLDAYRAFRPLNDKLRDDEDIQDIIREAEEEEEDKESEEVAIVEGYKFCPGNILYIRQNQGIVTKGVEKNLHDAGFRVISVSDEPDEIITHRFEADLILYQPFVEDKSHVGITMNMLGEICTDDHKMLFLMGDVSDLDVAKESSGAYAVTKIYTRPVKMPDFVDDMLYFNQLMSEYRRRKTIYIVDDDPDYVSVVTRWLSKSYNISSFDRGEDLIGSFSTCKPDLILLDYEMPGMDGYDLIKQIRSDEKTRDIPVIILTGKNDRGHVFRILNYKPDGYLLKTSKKEDLLDVIDRYFMEIMVKLASEPRSVDEEEE